MQAAAYNGARTVFKIFNGPLFHKPVTGQELLLEARYVKEALIVFGQNFKNLVIVYRLT